MSSSLRFSKERSVCMTEAVNLALIALVGATVFQTLSLILVGMVLKSKPSHFNFWTGYGHFDVSFDTKADES